jgi:hypothetical protein
VLGTVLISVVRHAPASRGTGRGSSEFGLQDRCDGVAGADAGGDGGERGDDGDGCD